MAKNPISNHCYSTYLFCDFHFFAILIFCHCCVWYVEHLSTASSSINSCPPPKFKGNNRVSQTVKVIEDDSETS